MATLRAKARERGLLDIGHHIIIDREGRPHLMRPLDVMGAHTPGHNHNSISVLMIGGLEEFTPEQIVALSLIGGMFLKEYPDGRIVAREEIQKRKGDAKGPSFLPMRSVVRRAKAMAEQPNTRHLSVAIQRANKPAPKEDLDEQGLIPPNIPCA